MKIKFLLLSVIAIFLYSCSSPSGIKTDTQVSSGNLLRYKAYDEAFGDTLTFDVWTPDGYSIFKKHPVLYMHDGQMLFDADKCWNHKAWEMDDAAGRLITSDSITPIIIVGIHNLPTRLCDYMPAQYDSLMAEGGEKAEMDKLFTGRKRGGEYVSAIVNTIKPIVDAEYHTNPAQEATAIMGSSMGGLISLYAICAYPDVFSSAICMSTHFSTSAERPELADAMYKYTVTHLPNPATHKFYFDNGTMPCDDAYIPFFNKMADTLKANGYGESNLLCREFPGHWHSEEYWASRVNIPLKFIYQKKE